MSRHVRNPKDVVAEVVDAVSPYADRLARDEKLRKRLIKALGASVAARQRVQVQAGLSGIALRLASDPVLRAQVTEAIGQLKGARKRVERKHRFHGRDVAIFVAGAGLAALALRARSGDGA